MHVVIHLSKFYDWDPLPTGITPTALDVASGKVMPGRDPGTWRMHVVKVPAGGTTERIAAVSEGMIISKIIEERCDIRRAGRIFNRKQAVAQAVAEHVLMSANVVEAQPDWITSIEVHDSGPDEKLLREMLAPHHEAEHARRGGKNVPVEDLEKHVAAYTESADAAAHVAHLHEYFHVKAVS